MRNAVRISFLAIVLLLGMAPIVFAEEYNWYNFREPFAWKVGKGCFGISDVEKVRDIITDYVQHGESTALTQIFYSCDLYSDHEKDLLLAFALENTAGWCEREEFSYLPCRLKPVEYREIAEKLRSQYLGTPGGL